MIATVHTPDAASGLRRLIDMGMDGGRLVEACQAVVSLRLVRRLCARCKKPFDAADSPNARERKLSEQIGIKPVNVAVGCPACAGTGFSGQVPLAEVLTISPEMERLLGAASDADLVRAARRDGMRSFLDVAIERVRQGETTVEEVERVLGIVPSRRESATTVGPVLVVEDERQDRLMVSALLKGMGFEVVEAESGEQAAAMLAEATHDFALVILDLFLPGMDGVELLRTIRRSLATQSLPVIVITSSPDPRHEIDLLEAGADDFLLKPIAVDRVEARVRAVLRRSGIVLADSAAGRSEPVMSPPRSHV